MHFHILLPLLFSATANACSCLPTYSLNNAMHAVQSVVRVWVSWELGTSNKSLRGSDDLDMMFDITPRYYAVNTMHWFKNEAKGKRLFVKTERHSSMCGVTLPTKQQAILFGGPIRYEEIPGYAKHQPVMQLGGCSPQITSLPIPFNDWKTLFHYQDNVCHLEDCGPPEGSWVNKGATTLVCGDNSTITSTCGMASHDQSCQWQAPDPSQCP